MMESAQCVDSRFARNDNPKTGCQL